MTPNPTPTDAIREALDEIQKYLPDGTPLNGMVRVQKALTALEAEMKELVGALKTASELSEALPELNNGNYDHDDVVVLNNGSIELCLFLRATLAKHGEGK
jgi:hypothetical protein